MESDIFNDEGPMNVHQNATTAKADTISTKTTPSKGSSGSELSEKPPLFKTEIEESDFDDYTKWEEEDQPTKREEFKREADARPPDDNNKSADESGILVSATTTTRMTTTTTVLAVHRPSAASQRCGAGDGDGEATRRYDNTAQYECGDVDDVSAQSYANRKKYAVNTPRAEERGTVSPDDMYPKYNTTNTYQTDAYPSSHEKNDWNNNIHHHHYFHHHHLHHCYYSNANNNNNTTNGLPSNFKQQRHAACGCCCVIDMSTPDTLQRDFYAWLHDDDRQTFYGSYDSQQQQQQYYYHNYNNGQHNFSAYCNQQKISSQNADDFAVAPPPYVQQYASSNSLIYGDYAVYNNSSNCNFGDGNNNNNDPIKNESFPEFVDRLNNNNRSESPLEAPRRMTQKYSNASSIDSMSTASSSCSSGFGGAGASCVSPNDPPSHCTASSASSSSDSAVMTIGNNGFSGAITLDNCRGVWPGRDDSPLLLTYPSSGYAIDQVSSKMMASHSDEYTMKSHWNPTIGGVVDSLMAPISVDAGGGAAAPQLITTTARPPYARRKGARPKIGGGPPSSVSVMEKSTNRRGTNLYGRPYCPGRPLSMKERSQIINLFHSGMKVNAISKQLCISHGCVSKIITRFRETGLLMPSSHSECRRRKRLAQQQLQQQHLFQQQHFPQQLVCKVEMDC